MKTFTVTEFIKGDTFAITSRPDEAQAALVAAYTAAGYTATVLGTSLEVGPAKALKSEAITVLTAAGKTLVDPGDRPAPYVSPEVRAARKAAREANRKAARAVTPSAYDIALARKKSEVSKNERAAKVAKLSAAAPLRVASPLRAAAPVAVDPAEEAAKAARKAKRKAAEAAAKAAAPKSPVVIPVAPTLKQVTTVVPKK